MADDVQLPLGKNLSVPLEWLLVCKGHGLNGYNLDQERAQSRGCRVERKGFRALGRRCGAVGVLTRQPACGARRRYRALGSQGRSGSRRRPSAGGAGGGRGQRERAQVLRDGFRGTRREVNLDVGERAGGNLRKARESVGRSTGWLSGKSRDKWVSVGEGQGRGQFCPRR